MTPSRLCARLRVPNRTAPTLEPRRSSGRSLRLPISPPVERRIRGPRCLTHGTGTMTVGVGRRKLSPVLLVLCIAGLLRSATAALNTPTCPAVLDAYTGGASLYPLNSGQQHTFSTTGVIQVRLNLTFGSNIDTNQVFFLFGALTQCGGLIGDVTTGGNLRISVNCDENDSDLGLSSGTGAVSPNTRYVIDYVYNQVTKLAEIYLDGVQIASGTKNWNEKVLDGYISVGDESHVSTYNAFQGTLHEVSMYDCGGRFTDKATLQSAVDACLLAVPSGCAEISDYDVSLVTDMSELFKAKAEFNADISAWNTSQVTDMNNMFGNAFAFNQDIGSWNTAQVTRMNAMFRGATAFNQDIGSWNTGQVTSMGGMFYDAWAFNGAVGTWNTAQVTDMADVFRHAAAFNRDISSWNTSQVTDMRYMFKRSRRLLPGYHRLERRVADHLHRDVYRRHRVARSSPARRRNRNLHRRSVECVGSQAVPRGLSSAVRLVRAVRRRRNQTGGRRPILG